MGIQQAIKKVSVSLTLAHQANPMTGSPLIWKRWYFDDGTLVGSMAQINEALSILLAAVGCVISGPKTSIWGLGTAQRLSSLPPTCPAAGFLRVPWTPTSGITLLGCPPHPPGSLLTSQQNFQYPLETWRRYVPASEEYRITKYRSPSFDPVSTHAG
jgi:hypothetical protein